MPDRTDDVLAEFGITQAEINEMMAEAGITQAEINEMMLTDEVKAELGSVVGESHSIIESPMRSSGCV